MGEQFATTDIGLAEKVLDEVFHGVRLSVRGQRGGIRLMQDAAGPQVELRRVVVSDLTFDAGVGALGALAIARLNAGTLAYGSGRDQRRYRAGQPFLVAQPEAPYLVECVDIDVEMTILDPRLLDQVAAPGPGPRSGSRSVRLSGHDPVSPGAAARWTRACAYFWDMVRSEPEFGVPPLVAANAGRMLAATALAVFPNTALTDPTIEDRHDASTVTLRRAVAFIDGSAHLDITVADIAAAAYVSLRAVQLAFRRHLDTTPTGYLNRVRLDRVHRELAAADPTRTTVSHIAARWGFHHLGRFAVNYRQTYGVSPSHTLNRN